MLNCLWDLSTTDTDGVVESKGSLGVRVVREVRVE